MHCRCIGRKLICFRGCSMDPAEWFHVSQVRMLRRLDWERHSLVIANLRYYSNGTHLLDLLIIFWCYSKEIAGHLNSQVRHTNKTLQNILWQNIGKSSLTQIFTVYVNMIGT